MDIKNFNAALRLQGFQVDEIATEVIAETYELVKEKGDKFSIANAGVIREKIDKKIKAQQMQVKK